MQKLDYKLLSPEKLKDAVRQINALISVSKKRWYIIDFGYADPNGKIVKQVKG